MKNNSHKEKKNLAFTMKANIMSGKKQTMMVKDGPLNIIKV